MDLVADRVDIQGEELIKLYLGTKAAALVESMIILCFASTKSQSDSELNEVKYHHTQMLLARKRTIDE